MGTKVCFTFALCLFIFFTSGLHIPHDDCNQEEILEINFQECPESNEVEPADLFVSHSPTELRKVVQDLNEKKLNGHFLPSDFETLRKVYKTMESRQLPSWWYISDFLVISDMVDDIDLQHRAALRLLEIAGQRMGGLALAKKLINATNPNPLSHPLRTELLDATSSYYVKKQKHDSAIEILQLALAERTNNQSANGWYNLLIQELIYSNRLEEAKEFAIRCLDELKETTNPAEFPYSCNQQYGRLLTLDGKYSEAFSYYQKLYTYGMQHWRNEMGEECAESSFVPVSLLPMDQLDPSLIESENILPKYLQELKKCSTQPHPFILLDDLVTQDFSQEMKCITQEEKTAVLYHLKEVTVLGRNKWIIQSGPEGKNCHLHTFSYPYELSRSIPSYVDSHISLWHTLPLKVIPKALIIHFADYNYYHLTIEVMSQVLLAIQHPLFQNNDFKILFSDSSVAYGLIKLLGFGSNVELYDWKSYRYHIVDAYVIDWRNNPNTDNAALDPQEYYVPPSNVVYFLKSLMDPQLPVPKITERNQVIFFTRQSTQQRSIANDELLYESIREIVLSNGYGLKIHTGKGRLDTQIEMLTRAVAVIGVHGAGLTNMIYCKPGTAVLEIPVNPIKTSVYSRLASSLNFPYWTIPEPEMFHYGENQNVTVLPIQQTVGAMLHFQKTRMGL